MMMPSANYRYVARESLRGKWPVSILVTLVAVLLGADSHSSTSENIVKTIRDTPSAPSDYFSNISPGAGVNTLFWFLLGTVTIAAILYAVTAFIVGAATDLGLRQYNMRLILFKDIPPFSAVFDRFGIFLKAFGLRFMMGLFTFLWALLFCIPGVVAAYSYSMAPYLMSQYPEMGIMEAISRSKELMEGHKWELFILHISFIGWHILSALTVGVGYLVLVPYINAAEAAFYLDITGQLQR